MFWHQRKYQYGRQCISWRDVWAVVKALRSDYLTQGPLVKRFEDELCCVTGAQYCVAVANGTAALHLAVLALDIRQGDEGITSPITFAASANCLLYAGGVAVFADIDPTTANINPQEIRKKITPRTKVIIPVHYAGQSCDMEEIHRIAQEKHLYVIEDAAHAIGSVYKGTAVGSCRYSDMTTFSFHPVKTITTGEGGAITTNNKKLYEKLLLLRTHGITRDANKMIKNDGPWYYEMQELGFNYRLTDLQAALGISQLKRLDSFVAKRRALVALYKTLLAKDEHFSFLEEKDFSQAGFHLCPILLNNAVIKLTKKEIFESLRARGLYLQVHYIPVHQHPYYRQFGYQEGAYPCAEQFYQKTLSLPLYPQLTERDIQQIVTIVKEVVR